jgi:hypothetical protein
MATVPVSDIRDVFGKAYQPAVMIFVTVVTLGGCFFLADSALSGKIDRQIEVATATQKFQTKSVDERHDVTLESHEQRIKALESTLTTINLSLTEIKADVKYLREAKSR